MYSLHKLSKYLEGDEDVTDGNDHDEVDSVVRGAKKRMKFRQLRPSGTSSLPT